MKIARLVLIGLLLVYFISFLIISVDIAGNFNFLLKTLDFLKYVAMVMLIIYLALVGIYFYDHQSFGVKIKKLEKHITELKAKLYDQDQA